MGTNSFAHTSWILPLTVKLPSERLCQSALPPETRFPTVLQHRGLSISANTQREEQWRLFYVCMSWLMRLNINCLDVYEMLAHILCPFSYWCVHLSYSFARALFIIEMSTFTICSPIYHLSFKCVCGIYDQIEHCFPAFSTQSKYTQHAKGNRQAASLATHAASLGGCHNLGTPVIHTHHIMWETPG